MRRLVCFKIFLCITSSWLLARPATGGDSLVPETRWLNTGRTGCRSLVVVSTMDGRITVLDPGQGGRQLWTMDTDRFPLLQSSLANIEIISGGIPYRILPSMDGSLYMFNEVGARSIPINVESLLSTSTRIGSDIFVGSKDVTTYGVDSVTGKVYYTCSSLGCEKHAAASPDEKLIIRRVSQIVRGVDVNTGHEKWNISVGEHQLFLSGNADTIDPCLSEMQDAVNSAALKYQIKVVPPDGTVYAVNKFVPSEVLWRKKFISPVVKVWQIDGSGLSELSLFDPEVVPPLQSKLLEAAKMDMITWPQADAGSLIYLGNYGEEHYIILSPEEKRAMQLHSKGQLQSLGRNPVYPLSYPVSGRLYQLPHLSSSGHQCLAGVECSVCSASEFGEVFEKDPEKNSGWYVFNPTTGSALQKWNQWDSYFSAAADAYQKYITQLMLVDAWEWWKHAVMMCVTLIFVPQIFIFMYVFRKRKDSLKLSQWSASPPVKRRSQESMTDMSASVGDYDFTSRFLKDFVPLRCLGCGGFGTVFESFNKVDEQKYAVKRIALPNRDCAKEKVIREVRALAKLDHPGIVRYYNSWFEEPPVEWLSSSEASVFDCRHSGDYVGNADSQLTTELPTAYHKGTLRSKHRAFAGVNLSSFDVDRQRHGCLKCSVRDDSLEIVFENSNGANLCQENGVGSLGKTESLESMESRKSRGMINQELQTAAMHKVFLFIQMQLCREYTLMDWLNVHLEDREQKVMLDWFRQIVEAMDYVHECGMIHRDLKPTNIFFSLTGQVKIGDFGLAKDGLSSCDQCSDAELEFVTSTNVDHLHTQNVGTYLYMSPEQETNASYTFKVDIYALGLIFVELMLPFATQMERIVTLRNLRKLKVPEVLHKSAAMCEFILKALSHEPDKRPSCKAILSSALFTDAV